MQRKCHFIFQQRSDLPYRAPTPTIFTLLSGVGQGNANEGLSLYSDFNCFLLVYALPVNVYFFMVLHPPPCPGRRWLLGSLPFCVIVTVAGGGGRALIREWILVLLWKECSLSILSLLSPLAPVAEVPGELVVWFLLEWSRLLAQTSLRCG